MSVDFQKEQGTLFSRWLPGTALVILTIGLMFYFRNYQEENENLLNEVKDDIFSFYTENLKPIFFREDLQSKDVFDFAFNRKLPVDRQGQRILNIVDTKDNSFAYKIVPAASVRDKADYETFIRELKLDERGKASLDSLLNLHKNEIYSSVLYNENNTIAVDPELAYIRKAIQADIYEFVADHLPSDKQEKALVVQKEEIKKIRENLDKSLEGIASNYIFFTPDTIFRGICDVDRDKIVKKLEEVELKEKSPGKQLEKFEMGFDIASDKFDFEPFEPGAVNLDLASNSYSVNLGDNFLPYPGQLPGLDSLDIFLDSLTTKLANISFAFTGNGDQTGFSLSFGKTESKGTDEAFNFEFNLGNLDSLIRIGIETGLKQSRQEPDDMEGLEIILDSLGNNIQMLIKDSTISKAVSGKRR